METMLAAAEARKPCETGGLLVGYWAAPSREAVITEATLAGPEATEEARSFTPDYDFDREIIAERFTSSGGTYTYLGDWHSHPHARVYLGADDVKTLRAIGRSAQADVEVPLMIVVGGIGQWEVGAWAWLGEQRRFLWRKDLIEPAPIQLVDDPR